MSLLFRPIVVVMVERSSFAAETKRGSKEAKKSAKHVDARNSGTGRKKRARQEVTPSNAHACTHLPSVV